MTRSLAFCLLISLAACASLSPRAQVTLTHQSIETLLATVDDSERVLCFGTVTLPANPTHCTTTAAAAAGLTDDAHRAISRVLMQAFDAQVSIGKLIQVWDGNSPVDMSLLVKAVAELDVQLARLNIQSPNLSKLLSDVLKWKAEIERLKALFGGAPVSAPALALALGGAR